MLRRSGVSAAVLAIAFSACGGGATAPPVTQPVAAPSAPPAPSADVLAVAHVATGVGLRPSAVFRRTRSAASIDTVTISGTLAPSYAGTTAVSNQQTVKPNADGTFDVSLRFSNAVPGNNAYLVLDLQAHGTDGSRFGLGQLAALVDVTSTGRTVILTPETTQRFQVYGAMLLNQLFSSVEAKQPDLDATLKTRLAATGVQPDASTHAYTGAQLDAIVQSLAPAYDRGVQITTDPRAAMTTLAWDWTNADEENLSASARTFQGLTVSALLRTDQPIRYVDRRRGGPCFPSSAATSGTQAARRTASASSTYPVCYRGQRAIGGSSTWQHAYGGPLIAGASTDQPFASGIVHLAGTAAGAVANASVALASSQADVAIFDTALQFSPFLTSDYGVWFDAGLVSPAAPSTYAQADITVPTLGTVALTHAGATAVVPVNTFNPADLPPAAVRLCTNWNGGPSGPPYQNAPCPPVASLAGTVYTVPRPFRDQGNNLGVYAYSVDGDLSIAQRAEPEGWYDVVLRSHSGALTTNAPGRFADVTTQSTPHFVVNYRYPDPPPGTTVAVVITTSAGAQYTGAVVHAPGSQSRITLPRTPAPFEPLSQLSVRWTLPKGVTTAEFGIRSLELSYN